MKSPMEIEKRHESMKKMGERGPIAAHEIKAIEGFAKTIISSWLGYEFKDHGKKPEEIGTPEVEKQTKEAFRIVEAYGVEVTKQIAKFCENHKSDVTINGKKLDIVAPDDWYKTKKALENYRPQ